MSADTPIAVLIPCHDDGATLGEAVESALRQDVPVQVIVIDDGSTEPGTLALLRRLAGEGIRVLRQDNRGPAPARMTGLHATDAEYALPLDADDRLPPGALRLLRDALGRQPVSRRRLGRRAPLRRARLRPGQRCPRSTRGSSATRTTSR